MSDKKDLKYGNQGRAARSPQSSHFSYSKGQQQQHSFNRSDPASARRDKGEAVPRFCALCGKANHIMDKCWRANNLCLICGLDHRMKDCPRYDPDRRQRIPTNDLKDKVSIPWGQN